MQILFIHRRIPLKLQDGSLIADQAPHVNIIFDREVYGLLYLLRESSIEQDSESLTNDRVLIDEAIIALRSILKNKLDRSKEQEHLWNFLKQVTDPSSFPWSEDTDDLVRSLLTVVSPCLSVVHLSIDRDLGGNCCAEEFAVMCMKEFGIPVLAISGANAVNPDQTKWLKKWAPEDEGKYRNMIRFTSGGEESANSIDFSGFLKRLEEEGRIVDGKCKPSEEDWDWLLGLGGARELELLENLDGLLQGWLAVWDKDEHREWQEIWTDQGILQDEQKEIYAQTRTRPDCLFRSNHCPEEFWFKPCEKDIRQDVWPFTESEARERSWQQASLPWEFPRDSSDVLTNCEPILHEESSRDYAKKISELLVAKPFAPQRNLPPGGFLRLVLEAVSKGVDINGLPEDVEEDVKTMLVNFRSVLIDGLGNGWADLEDGEDLYDNENTEDIRRRLLWLFKHARNEYLSILQGIEVMKKLAQFEEERRLLNHNELTKEPFSNIWKESSADDEIRPALKIWRDKIFVRIRHLCDGTFCPDLKLNLPDHLHCSSEDLLSLRIPSTFHHKLLNDCNEGCETRIDGFQLMDKINLFADMVFDESRILGASDRENLTETVLLLRLWLHQMSGFDHLLKYVEKVEGIPEFCKEKIHV